MSINTIMLHMQYKITLQKAGKRTQLWQISKYADFVQTWRHSFVTWHDRRKQKSEYMSNRSTRGYWKLRRDPPLFTQVILEKPSGFHLPSLQVRGLKPAANICICLQNETFHNNSRFVSCFLFKNYEVVMSIRVIFGRKTMTFTPNISNDIFFRSEYSKFLEICQVFFTSMPPFGILYSVKSRFG